MVIQSFIYHKERILIFILLLVLDALIVACKMIVLQCKALKYTKQISIFTDAKEEIDWSDLDFVAETVRNNGIDLRVV